MPSESASTLFDKTINLNSCNVSNNFPSAGPSRNSASNPDLLRKYPDESVFLAGLFVRTVPVVNGVGLLEPDSLFDLPRVRGRTLVSDWMSLVAPLPATSRCRLPFPLIAAPVVVVGKGCPKLENAVEVKD
ncbi:hypothetical protein F66182_15171 [Fusarium sp. NRRL 66182]|nr:hypothetical protein F66182_15171 [Fusarium sp. NRRL 66182]